jgi:hypothetical protein
MTLPYREASCFASNRRSTIKSIAVLAVLAALFAACSGPGDGVEEETMMVKFEH